MFEWLINPYDYPFWLLMGILFLFIIWIFSRSFSTYVKFVYPNAKYEAIGNPFISEKELTKLIECKDVDSFKESLNFLKDYNAKGESIYEVHNSLDNHYLKTIEMMRYDSSKKMNDFFDFFIEKYDLIKVKNIIKRKILNKKIEDDYIDSVRFEHTKNFLQKIIESDKENIINILKSNGYNKELIDSLSGEKLDFIAFDSEFDKLVIDKFRKMNVPYKCDKAKDRLLQIMIDIGNIKNVLRAKQLGYEIDICKKLFIGEGYEIASWKYAELANVDSIPQIISSLEGTSYFDLLKDDIEVYNKEDSVQVFENTLDVVFLKLIKEISIKHYVTIGPSIRFLISKEFEIKNLKIIVKGISERIPSELIKSLMIVEVSS